MGWYTITKTVNGRQYLYRQTSWREGGRVRTKSEYIGPVESAAASTPGPTLQPTSQHVHPDDWSAHLREEQGAPPSQAPAQVAPATTDHVEPPPSAKMPTAPAATADPPRNLPIAKQPETSKAVAGPAEEPITDPGDFTDQLATTLAGLIYRKTNAKEKRAELTDGVKIHRNLRRADISAEALAGEQRRVLKVMTATGLSIDKLKTLTVKIGQEPGYRSFPNAVVVSMPKTGHRTAAKAAYRQGLARRWLEQLARQNETAFKGLREDIDEPYREGKRALMSYYWRSGHKGRFMGALYLTATGQMPEWWRKNVRPEGLGLIDHAGSKGWKDDTVKIAGQIIGQGRAKTLSKYEREWRKAASNLRTKERTWREMTLADRFTSRRKKAYREMRKAQARVRATKAMTKKARAVSFWMFGQRPNGKAAPWVKFKK